MNGGPAEITTSFNPNRSATTRPSRDQRAVEHQMLDHRQLARADVRQLAAKFVGRQIGQKAELAKINAQHRPLASPICRAARRIEPSPPRTSATSNSTPDRSDSAARSTNATSTCCAISGNSRSASRAICGLSLEDNSSNRRTGTAKRLASRGGYAGHGLMIGAAGRGSASWCKSSGGSMFEI